MREEQGKAWNLLHALPYRDRLPILTASRAALASCSRKAAHDGTALESLVACLQPPAHVVIYPCRSTPFAGHPRQRERETPSAPATPTQRKTAVPVHDLHDWNSRPLVPVLPSPAFFLASSLQHFCIVLHSCPLAETVALCSTAPAENVSFYGLPSLKTPENPRFS